MRGRRIGSAIRRRGCSAASRSIRSCTPIRSARSLFPLIAMVSGAPLIGWAKPVPVNVRQLRHPRRDYVLVAAAGPASNLRAGGASPRSLLAVLPVSPQTLGEPNVSAPLAALLSQAMRLNVLLAVFNMIPIPPLDGGNVLAGLLPPSPGGACSIRSAAVRLPPALRADAHRRVRATSSCRRIASSCPGCRHSDSEGARRVRHAADRPAASRPSGRRARQLGAAAGRSTTASTSSPTGTR